MRALSVAVALVVVARASIAAACDCAVTFPFVSGKSMTLGPDATLYLFVPEIGPELPEQLIARQGDTEIVLAPEQVGTVERGKVMRLQLRGLAPGELTIALGSREAHTWKVEERAPARAWPHVLAFAHNGNVGGCEDTGPSISIAGDRAAAFRLRWTEAGTSREVYLPALEASDAHGNAIRGVQRVQVGDLSCEMNWLGVDPKAITAENGRIELDDAELTMLGVDGDEQVVLRGGVRYGVQTLLAWTSPPRPLPPEAPPVVAAPPPVAGSKIVWWRVAAGTGGGLTLGAAFGFLAFGRRRRAT